MNLSIILILSDNGQNNNATLANLNEELQGDEQLLLCGTAEQKQTCPGELLSKAVWIDTAGTANEYEAFRLAAERVTGEFVTQLNSGDTLSAGWMKAVQAAAA
jgi:hypothetical protein